MSTVIACVGQPVAGDDGVGAAVAARLGERRPDLSVVEVVDPSDLVLYAEGGERLIVVDAALADEPPGTVLRLRADDVGPRKAALVSSHGFSVTEALAMARALRAGAPLDVEIVAVVIGSAGRYREGLSPEVAAAVDQAVDAVLAAAGEA